MTAEYRITSKLVGWAENINRFAFMMNVGIALFLYLAISSKQLIGKIQERAGIARDEAEKQLADWETRHPDARFHD